MCIIGESEPLWFLWRQQLTRYNLVGPTKFLFTVLSLSPFVNLMYKTNNSFLFHSTSWKKPMTRWLNIPNWLPISCRLRGVQILIKDMFIRNTSIEAKTSIFMPCWTYKKIVKLGLKTKSFGTIVFHNNNKWVCRAAVTQLLIVIVYVAARRSSTLILVVK